MDSQGGRSSEFLNHYSFLHESSMVDFNSIQRMSRDGMRRIRSEAEKEEEEFSAGDDDDDIFLFRLPGMRKRLSMEQVKYLEKSFAVDNNLEPERKILIAKQLGLLPQQVAIWFLNRRDTFLTKQMEHDYDVLKSDFESLKADYNSQLLINNRLRYMLAAALRTELNRLPAPEKLPAEALLPCKQQEASSAKSDVFDSKSPEGNNTTAVGPNQSDYSPEVVYDSGAGLPELEGQPSYWPWFY